MLFDGNYFLSTLNFPHLCSKYQNDQIYSCYYDTTPDHLTYDEQRQLICFSAAQSHCIDALLCSNQATNSGHSFKDTESGMILVIN